MSIKKFAKRRKTLWVLGLSIVGLAMALGAAFVVAQSSTVPGFTGCLRVGDRPIRKGVAQGQFYNFAQGEDPQTPCEDGDLTVKLNSGDITAVVADQGLDGGGDSGEVTLGLQDSYKLPQNCADNQLAEWNAGTLTWNCATNESTPYTAGEGLNLNGYEFLLANNGISGKHLNLVKDEKYFGPNVAITSFSAPGQTVLSLIDLEPGTYIIYGLAQAYVDQAADTDGGISFVINNGSTVVRPGPQFYFTKAAGWLEQQSSGFMYVIKLTELKTTLNLAAYKGPGAVTTGVVGGGTHFGYIKIQE